jgi:FMN phosphatase YigB (HAD superfamily)
LFNHVWSCDDFNTSKADPGIYTRAAEILGYPVEEILFLDDNAQAVATAKSAGMKVCGVFDPTSAECREEMIRDCDYYLDDFSTLPTLA